MSDAGDADTLIRYFQLVFDGILLASTDYDGGRGQCLSVAAAARRERYFVDRTASNINPLRQLNHWVIVGELKLN